MSNVPDTSKHGVNSSDCSETSIAISTALKESKPVYISVGCNLSAIPHPTFTREPGGEASSGGWKPLLKLLTMLLNKAVKRVMVGGPKLRVTRVLSS